MDIRTNIWMAKAMLLPFLLSCTVTAETMSTVNKGWMSTEKGVRSARKMANKQITQKDHREQY